MELTFEWDEKKAKANFKKHKVSFEEAKTIFNDPLLLTFPDFEHSNGEQRQLTEFSETNVAFWRTKSPRNTAFSRRCCDITY